MFSIVAGIVAGAGYIAWPDLKRGFVAATTRSAPPPGDVLSAPAAPVPAPPVAGPAPGEVYVVGNDRQFTKIDMSKWYTLSIEWEPPAKGASAQLGLRADGVVVWRKVPGAK